MIISFKKIEEAIYFCKQLHLHNNCYQYIKKQQKRRRILLQLDEQYPIEDIMHSFQAVFNHFRFKQAIHQIIEQVYFYEKYDEVQSILHYSMAQFSNDHQMRKVFSENERLKDIISNLFKREVSSQHNLSFDKMVFDLLNQIRPFLIDVTGLAIDEWKDDLHYDSFIQSVKNFISWQPLKTNVLHIVQRECFIYYKNNGEKYYSDELTEVINKSLIYSVGLSENEWNLSPVIALAPKLLYIYGNDETDEKTLTVIKLFPGRASFLPEALFPFNKNK